MEMRHSAWLLVLWSGFTLARDPFQPLAEVQCQMQAAEPDGWRLQGIIGTPTRYVAWLRSPEGKNHRLGPSARLPRSSWQVAALTANSMTLHVAQSCPPQQIIWSIKGGYYEMDDTTAVPEFEPAPAGK
jgi:pilus assembly protein HofP